MIFKGKITSISDTVNGTSAKGEWSKRTIAMIETEGQYPQSVCFDDFNCKLNVSVGEEGTANLNSRCNEHNGRHYNSLTCWKFESAGSGTPQTPQPSAPQEQQPEGEAGNLPF